MVSIFSSTIDKNQLSTTDSEDVWRYGSGDLELGSFERNIVPYIVVEIVLEYVLLVAERVENKHEVVNFAKTRMIELAR